MTEIETVKLMERSGISPDKIKIFLDSNKVPIVESVSKPSPSLQAMTKVELEALLTQRQMEKYGYTKFKGSKFNPDDAAYNLTEHLNHPLFLQRLTEIKWQAMGGAKPEYPGSKFVRDIEKSKDNDKEDVKTEPEDEEVDLHGLLNKLKEIAIPDGQSSNEKKRIPVEFPPADSAQDVPITQKSEIPDELMLEPGWDDEADGGVSQRVNEKNPDGYGGNYGKHYTKHSKPQETSDELDEDIDKEIDAAIEEITGTDSAGGYNTPGAFQKPGQTSHRGIESATKLGMELMKPSSLNTIKLREAIEELKQNRKKQ